MALPTFYADESFADASTLTLGEDAAHHMRVRRLEIGARIRVLDGQGHRGEGTLTQLAKRHAAVSIELVEDSAPPPPLHLLLPVADKDRMLWLAEKAAELCLTSWRPVSFRRSKHVNPRGEGPVFLQKTKARMIAAMEQSGSAWLPTMYPDATVEHAIAARPEGIALVLDAGAPPMLDVLRAESARRPLHETHVTVVIGPEGGFEAAERAAFEAAGFTPCAIGASVLRFETAAVAALAVARAAQDSFGAT